MNDVATTWMTRAALGLSLVALGASLWTALRAEPVAEATADRTPPAVAASDTKPGTGTPAGDEAPRAAPVEPPVSTTATAEATPSAKSATEKRLQMRRLVVTKGIENREPMASDGFAPDGTPVFAFAEIANASDDPQDIVVTFEHPSGARVGNVQLAVPKNATRYRTWAKTGLIRKEGTWTAVVRTKDGEELGRADFVVGAQPEAAG